MIGFVGMIIVITPQKILRRTVEEKFQFLNKENLSPQCLHTLDIVRHEPTLLKRITLDTTLSLPFFPASSVIDLYSDGPEKTLLIKKCFKLGRIGNNVFDTGHLFSGNAGDL